MAPCCHGAARAFCLLIAATVTASGQLKYFAGAGPGIAILSSASRAAVSAGSASVSNYEPKPGPLLHIFGGWHAWEYVSLQAAWSANRNGLTLSSTIPGSGFYQERRNSSQENLGADALVYFRERRSIVRPFLSAGFNYMWFRSERTELLFSSGTLRAPANFSGRRPGLRVAAGMDVMHRKGWGFRYAFMEHLQGNVIGSRLSPPATTKLMNFQHLFAVIRTF